MTCHYQPVPSYIYFLHTFSYIILLPHHMSPVPLFTFHFIATTPWRERPRPKKLPPGYGSNLGYHGDHLASNWMYWLIKTCTVSHNQLWIKKKYEVLASNKYTWCCEILGTPTQLFDDFLCFLLGDDGKFRIFEGSLVKIRLLKRILKI